MSAPTTLLRFPPELLLTIADYLSTRDLSRLSRTCDSLYTLYSRLLTRRFTEEATFILLWALALPWHPSTAKRALANGADPNGTNTGANPYRPMWDYDFTALWLTVVENKVPAATMLLEAGADINVKDTSLDMVPMYYAEQCRYEKMAELLASYGAESITVDPLELLG